MTDELRDMAATVMSDILILRERLWAAGIDGHERGGVYDIELYEAQVDCQRLIERK